MTTRNSSSRKWRYGIAAALVLILGAFLYSTWSAPSVQRTIQPRVIAGGFNGAFIDEQGDLWMWGDNRSGTLGNGTTESSLAPIQNPDMEAVYALSLGGHAMALKADGTLWGWGHNADNAMGVSTENVIVASPVPISGIEDVVAVAVGYGYTVACTGDGQLWVWGQNQYGQLGTGATSYEPFPHAIEELNDVVGVAAGASHSLALEENGQVWSVGYNQSGELGDGTNESRLTWSRVPNLEGVTQVAAGEWHSLALKEDGTVWAWGENDLGQLGYGTTSTDQWSPVQIASLSDIVEVAAGDAHSVALKADGTVWTWGFNYYGQLGTGNAESQWAPVQVPDLENIVDVAAASNFTFALGADGTVWVWGNNNLGQLGLGDTTDRWAPTVNLSL